MTFLDEGGNETVSYTGQTARQLLIADMFSAIGNLSEDPTQDVDANIGFYFRADVPNEDVVSTFPVDSGIAADSTLSVAPTNGAGEVTYGAISSGKNLSGKIAGADKVEHLLDADLLGWDGGLADPTTPTMLVEAWIDQLHSAATDGNAVTINVEGGTAQINEVYITEDAIDLRQLLQKFLSMAVGFSQGTTDYLQTDFTNTLAVVDGKPYSTAEHHWDEGFGYFGAAVNYNELSDNQIADDRYVDSNNDGVIDIRSEVNLGHSVNCAKRDLGTANNANPTDFTKDAFDAFLDGRYILRQATAAGALTPEQQTELTAAVTKASVTWEKCVAATVVHYINDTIADIQNFSGTTYKDADNFKNLAKHWSEMKGFALGLQFSVESPFWDRANGMRMADLITVLDNMGEMPVKPSAGTDEVNAYVQGLLEARDLLQEYYSFDADNVANW